MAMLDLENFVYVKTLNPKFFMRNMPKKEKRWGDIRLAGKSFWLTSWWVRRRSSYGDQLKDCPEKISKAFCWDWWLKTNDIRCQGLKPRIFGLSGVCQKFTPVITYFRVVFRHSSDVPALSNWSVSSFKNLYSNFNPTEFYLILRLTLERFRLYRT